MVCLVLLLIGCRTFQPDLSKPTDGSVKRALATLSSYKVKRLALDYAAKCRIRIKTPTVDENGSCHITITRNNQFRLTILSPLGGTLLMVYQDEERIQVINYHDKTALQLKNSEKNRYRAFEIVNLNVAEFRSIFWGREIEKDHTSLEFSYEGEKPIRIKKRIHRSDQLVTIKKWLSYQDIWFPKIIEFEDRPRQIYLKVAITVFDPHLYRELKPVDIPKHFIIRN